MNKEFKIPKGYFDDVEHKILQSAIKKNKNEFLVPDNYLKDIEVSILNKATKKRNIKLFYLRNISIAASVLLLIIISFKTTNDNVSLSQISQEEIIEYLSENMDSDVLDSEINIENIQIENKIIPKNTIINYFEENEIDDDFINNI